MNQLQYATITALPDSHGYALARVAGGSVRVYVDPLRFVAPAPVPAVDDRVQVAQDAGGTLSVIAILGRGVPT